MERGRLALAMDASPSIRRDACDTNEDLCEIGELYPLSCSQQESRLTGSRCVIAMTAQRLERRATVKQTRTTAVDRDEDDDGVDCQCALSTPI